MKIKLIALSALALTMMQGATLAIAQQTVSPGATAPDRPGHADCPVTPYEYHWPSRKA